MDKDGKVVDPRTKEKYDLSDFKNRKDGYIYLEKKGVDKDEGVKICAGIYK